MTFFLRLALLSAALLTSPTAEAASQQDLARAADASLSEAERMSSFNRLVMDFSTARPMLEATIRDPDADSRQRWVAARVMGQSSSKDALAPLLLMSADPQPAMRAAAAAALGDLRDAGGVERLCELLKDEAIMVRAEAATALGRCRDERGARALEAALRDPTNFYRGSSLWVRARYVEAIAEIGLRSSVPALVACLDDRDPAVGDAALVALRKITGMNLADGRTPAEEKEAWRRWAAAQRF